MNTARANDCPHGYSGTPSLTAGRRPAGKPTVAQLAAFLERNGPDGCPGPRVRHSHAQRGPQTLQSYALDHTTRTLEICDFASGGEQACERHVCRPSRQLADQERPTRDDARDAAKTQKVSLFSVPESSLRTFSLCLKMITTAIRSANMVK